MVKRIVIGIVIVFILAGAGYYAWTNFGYKLLPATTKRATLAELVASKASLVCTYNQFGSSGKLYLSGGKVRGEFGTNFSIFDGQNSYLWSSDSDSGIKIPFAPKTGNEESQTFSTGVVDTVTPINYSCSQWKPNESLFAPPSNVTFSSPSIPSSNQNSGSDSGIIIVPTVNSQ